MGNDTRDDGQPLDEHETKGGWNRYEITSLLQKAIRRSDREKAMFAAFELTRSGYAWNFWDRIQVILLEDTRLAPEEASLLPAIERLRLLANKKWDPDEGMGIACAMRAASLLAEADSSHELLVTKNSWKAIAEDRMKALNSGEEPDPDFPVPPAHRDWGDLEYVVCDTHTATGSRAGRNMAHYLIEASRTTETTALGEKYTGLMMEEGISYDLTEEQIEHGTSPVPEDDPWEAPRDIGFPRH